MGFSLCFDMPRFGHRLEPGEESHDLAAVSEHHRTTQGPVRDRDPRAKHRRSQALLIALPGIQTRNLAEGPLRLPRLEATDRRHFGSDFDLPAVRDPSGGEFPVTVQFEDAQVDRGLDADDRRGVRLARSVRHRDPEGIQQQPGRRVREIGIVAQHEAVLLDDEAETTIHRGGGVPACGPSFDPDQPGDIHRGRDGDAAGKEENDGFHRISIKV